MEANQLNPKIRILAVDDHALLRGGIASMLGSQGDMELVGEASNGREAVDMCLNLRPSITLMDIQMPVMDGIEATEKICSVWPNARVVVLTTYRGDVQARRAIKAGARGFLLKSMLRHELLETVRSVCAGEICLPAELARDVAMHATEAELTSREIQILQRVALGYSNKQIGSVLNITEDTVKAHMKSVMSKMSASDRTHAVTLAVQRGLIDLAN